MIPNILLCMIAACAIGLIYLAVWVGPRINRIYNVQKSINKLVFMDNRLWGSKMRMCNRDVGEVQYGFGPINMRTFLSEEEIDELHTIDGEKLAKSKYA